MARTRILGTGFVVGEHLVTNDALAKLMDTSDQWIRERSGVEERYYVEDGTTTSDLGLGASRKALDDAGVAAGEIDYIVFATMTPDHFFPGCGGLLQAKLGIGQVPALDIRQQCTGFIYGLQVSDALIRAGQARTVLLVGAEVHSGFMPWGHWDYLFGEGGEAPTAEERRWITKFRDRTVLFGDAGGACVLRAAEGERGLIGFEVRSDGTDFETLYVPSCGFAQRPYVTEADLREGRHIPASSWRSRACRKWCARCARRTASRCATSTCSSPTKPTCASTRWCSARWNCPTRRSSTTSSATATPPRPPSPSRWTRRASRAG